MPRMKALKHPLAMATKRRRRRKVSAAMAANRKSRAKYSRTRIASPKEFDPRSFRTIDPGRPGGHKMVVGCPKGQWDAKRGRCRVGMEVQSVMKEKRNIGKNPLLMVVPNEGKAKGRHSIKLRIKGKVAGSATYVPADPGGSWKAFWEVYAVGGPYPYEVFVGTAHSRKEVDKVFRDGYAEITHPGHEPWSPNPKRSTESIFARRQLERGKHYKITLPPGTGQPLYTGSFSAAKEMAKMYGKGTRVVDMRKRAKKNAPKAYHRKMRDRAQHYLDKELGRPGGGEAFDRGLYMGSLSAHDASLKYRKRAKKNPLLMVVPNKGRGKDKGKARDLHPWGPLTKLAGPFGDRKAAALELAQLRRMGYTTAKAISVPLPNEEVEWFIGYYPGEKEKKNPGKARDLQLRRNAARMKIKPEDYEILRLSLRWVLDRHPQSHLEYAKAGLSDERFRWDVLHASRLNTFWLYKYLNDNHIDTALRSIVAEWDAEQAGLIHKKNPGVEWHHRKLKDLKQREKQLAKSGRLQDPYIAGQYYGLASAQLDAIWEDEPDLPLYTRSGRLRSLKHARAIQKSKTKAKKNPGKAWHKRQRDVYRKRLTEDLKAGHGGGADYWQGASSAEARAIAAKNPPKIAALISIAHGRKRGRIDKRDVSPQAASAIMKIYNALDEKDRSLFAKAHIDRMAKVAQRVAQRA